MRVPTSTLLPALILVILVGSQETNQVHNTLREIQAKEDRVDLELIKEWGGEDEQDENKLFLEPRDIFVEKSGHTYILDASRIQVFDGLGKYIKTIGGIGEGPQDFLDPVHLAVDNQGNILVVDGGRNYIKILSPDGKYIGGFPLEENHPGPIEITEENEILMSNKIHTKEATDLWIYYDRQGKILRRKGRRQSGPSELVNDKLYQVKFALDENSNLYAAYVYRPLLQVYSAVGELILESTYEVPFDVPEIRSFRKPEGIFIEAEIICRGISVDSKGRIYLLTLTRSRNTEERKIGYVISAISRDGRISKKERMKFDIDTHETDLYKILILNKSGEIIGSKKLSNHVNDLRIYADRVFLIDGYVNMRIYEYK